MKSTTTRRSLLKATPIALVAISLPVPAIAGTHPDWERLKRDYADACRRWVEASEAEIRRDSEEMDFSKSAPTRQITCEIPGWEQQTTNIKIVAAPTKETVTLTRHNVDTVSGEVKAMAEYAAFRNELAEWERTRVSEEAARGWRATEEEWFAALNAQDTAWRALVGFPAQSLAMLREKIELATQYDMMSNSGLPEDLVEAIALDLGRLGEGA